MYRTVETDRLLFKVLDGTKADLVLEYYLKNKAFLKDWEPMRHDGFYSIETQAMSLDLDLSAMERGEMLRYWIFLKETDELIGTIALTNIIRGVFKSCYLGYKLSEKHTGHSYMTEAILKMVEIAFVELKLHRIEANIMPSNLSSKRVVIKNGFVDEGLSSKYLKINGKWEDHHRYVLINDDTI